MMDKISDNLIYSYKFKFNDGSEKTFEVILDPNNLIAIRKPNSVNPDWTSMQNFQCKRCPIDKTLHNYCPIALNLIDIISFFSNTSSFEEIDLEVQTPERTYFKRTSVQVGVGGILGILMPTSGCPVLGKLKPLARFHLPFASIQETEFRVFSMYLLAQYFKMRKGKNTDWEMNNLKNLYEDIQSVNVNIAKKIADLEKKDASINAVVVLNNFADSITFSLDEDDLSDIEFLFNEFIQGF